MLYNFGDGLQPKDLVSMWRIKPLGGSKLGDWRKADTVWAGGSCIGMGVEGDQVWHPGNKEETDDGENDGDDPKGAAKDRWWGPGQLPGRVSCIKRAATNSLASSVGFSSPLPDTQFLVLE